MKIKIIYILCILLTAQASYSMTNDTLTKIQYDSIKQKLLKEIGKGSQYWKDGFPRELRLYKSEVAKTPSSNPLAPIAAPNPNDNTPQTYGPYPDNDPSPVVTDLCDDGDFEVKNFSNWSWDMIPNHRMFEGSDNWAYNGELTLNFNDKILNATYRANSCHINSCRQLQNQIASNRPWWWASIDYFPNNLWEIIDTSFNYLAPAVTPMKHDPFFIPKSKGGVNYLGIKRVYGGKRALKLGDWMSNNGVVVGSGAALGASTISKKITVTADKFLISFRYALVFSEHNGGHGHGNPFFGVRVFDNNSNSFTYLPFGPTPTVNGAGGVIYYPTNPLYMYVYPDNSGPNIFYEGKNAGQSDYVHGKPWTCGTVDLSQYIGKTINLEFVVSDCYKGCHFGYAYIDNICDITCIAKGGVNINNISIPCGPNSKIEGSFYNPPVPNVSNQFYPLDSIFIALYNNGNEIKRFKIPSSSSSASYKIINNSFGTFSVNSSFIYDQIYSIVPNPYYLGETLIYDIMHGSSCFDIVAIAYFKGYGSEKSSTDGFSKLGSPSSPFNDDWCYCCGSRYGLKNQNESLDNITSQDCNMKISYSKDSIDFPPANKYNYFISKSKLYDELLKNKFNFMNSSGFVPNDPSKIDSFNYFQIAQDYDCKNETQWYEVTYKHPICPYYTKLKVETTCKVPLSCDNVTCEKKDSITLNPYLTNLMGNWRPAESYVYNIKRKAETQNVRKGEYFENRFVPAYEFNGTGWERMSSNNLVRNDRILNYDDAGNPVENKNPLNIYSTKKYAYKNALTHLTASNAKFEECMYYSFETLDHNDNHLEFRIPNGTISNPFYEKINKATGSLTTETAHTGNYSYKVMKLGTVSNIDTPYVSTLEFFCGSPSDDATPNYKINANVTQVRANDNSFKPVFDLKPGSEYTLSYWTKNIDNSETALGYIGRSYECKTVDKRVLSSTITQPIEGWYHVTENFIVPITAKLLKLVFYPNNTGSYFDDIRIFPSEANMKSYVYNTQNKMTAELDENNYATFFDYDDEENLIRVRKETERGIMTLKENRLNLKQR